MTKKTFEKPLKRLFKSVKLCYSIDEADRSSWLNFTRIYPIRTYRQNVFADQRFNVWQECITHTTQEVPAYMYGDGKIYLIGKFCVRILNDYMQGNHFSKVIHSQPCENLLGDVLLLFCVETNEPHGIF